MYDSSTGLTTRYSYDFTGRTGATELHGANGLELWVSEQYDAHNRPTSQTRQFESTRYTDSYAYNTDGTLQSLSLGNLRTITYEYDGLKRITAMNTGSDGVNGRTFTYRTVNGYATSQIQNLVYDEIGNKANQTALTFSYTYDKNGNILTYAAPNESTVTYTYNTQNQLLRATGGTNYIYTYDDAGNILSAKKGNNTYIYSYDNTDWGDLLTAYNGTAIGYDQIGNPTSYYNGWNFTWKQGREMATATKSGQSLSFTYDADGVRRTKTVNGVEHTYYYVGGKLARETYGNNILDFFYDQNGHPFMLVYNGVTYYYITNAQGDVIRLVDIYGNIAAMYQYDPYGNTVTALGSHATINPLRYRGYYYDSETNLYYLQSRYYDPNIGRFINADNYPATGQGLIGNNMFAYCGNNPVRFVDESGMFFFTAIGAVTGFISGAIISAIQGKSSEECLKDALAGAAGGAVAGAGVDVGLAIIGTCGTALPAVLAAGAVAFCSGGAGNVLSTEISSNGTASDEELEVAFWIGGFANVASLGTSLGAAATSLEGIAVAGMNNLTSNVNTSMFITYTAGAVTTIAQPWLAPQETHSMNNSSSTTHPLCPWLSS